MNILKIIRVIRLLEDVSESFARSGIVVIGHFVHFPFTPILMILLRIEIGSRNMKNDTFLGTLQYS